MIINMSYTYQYSQSVHFPSGMNSVQLLQDITDSVLINREVICINTEGDAVFIIFSHQLSYDEHVALNDVVNKYIYNINFIYNSTEYNVLDIKSPGTNGGTITSNVWTVRDLNSIEKNGQTLTDISLVDNEITLQQGVYVIRVSAPAYGVRNHQARIYNVTTDSVLQYGNSSFSSNNTTISEINYTLSCAVPTTIRVEHWAEQTTESVGLGISSGYTNEIYTQVNIVKNKYFR